MKILVSRVYEMQRQEREQAVIDSRRKLVCINIIYIPHSRTQCVFNHSCINNFRLGVCLCSFLFPFSLYSLVINSLTSDWRYARIALGSHSHVQLPPGPSDWSASNAIIPSPNCSPSPDVSHAQTTALRCRCRILAAS
jgi:hypothetical protein